MFQTENFMLQTAGKTNPQRFATGQHSLKSRLQKAKARKKIVLDPNGILILGILFFVSIGLVFYLGMSLGKTFRLVKAPLNGTLTSSDQDPSLAAKALAEAASKVDLDKLSLKSVTDKSLRVSEIDKKIQAIDHTLNSNLTKVDKKTDPFVAEPTAALATTKASSPPLENTVAAKTDSAQAPDLADYSIQVSSLNNIQGANLLLRQLKEQGFDAYILSTASSAGGRLYQVRVGNHLNGKTAPDLLKQVKVAMAGLAEPILFKNTKNE